MRQILIGNIICNTVSWIWIFVHIFTKKYRCYKRNITCENDKFFYKHLIKNLYFNKVILAT